MAEQNYLEWLGNQPHKPGDKITNWQKLTSRFLPPKGVDTWGEWYAAEGVTYTPRREEAKRVTSKQVSSKVEILKRKVNLLKLQLTTPGISQTEQNKLIQEFRTAQDDLLDAEKELLETEANEGKLKEEDANKRASDILRFDVRRLRERKQLTERLGQPTDEIDQELAAKEADLKKSIKPTGVVESSFGPPEVRAGRPVTGTGGRVTAPEIVTPPVARATQPAVAQTPTQTRTTTPATGGAGETGQTTTTGGTNRKGGKGKQEVPAETFESIIEAARGNYGGIDEVFRTNPELQGLLKKAIGKVGDPTDDFTNERFLSELENTSWWKSNAGPIRQRGFYKRQYDDLVKTLKTDDPNYQTALAELNRTSEYGRGLTNAIATVKNTARSQGVQIDDDTVTIIAKNLYDYANEGDATKIREAVLGAGKFGVGGLYTGAAGNNIRILRDIAAANGLDFDTQFATSKDTWLAKIAQGESIETFKDLIRKSAQNAWAVDDRTRALLDQGVDLETIYSPFKKTMATILELPEDKITLNDLASKGVLGGEKPMNLYDFRKALRQDERWQYTENARTEMSNLTENLLRDFGFVR
jgi:hypothetical protein